jgi:hypothetical protein
MWATVLLFQRNELAALALTRLFSIPTALALTHSLDSPPANFSNVLFTVYQSRRCLREHLLLENPEKDDESFITRVIPTATAYSLNVFS